MAETAPANIALFTSLDPETVNPFSSSAKIGVFSHQERICVSTLRMILSHEFLISLIEKNEPRILKLFFYLFPRTLDHWNPLKPRLLVLTQHEDESVREQSYLSLIQIHIWGMARTNGNPVGPKDDHPLFQKAATDPSPIIRRLAHRFIFYNDDSNAATIEKLLFSICRKKG